MEYSIVPVVNIQVPPDGGSFVLYEHVIDVGHLGEAVEPYEARSI